MYEQEKIFNKHRDKFIIDGKLAPCTSKIYYDVANKYGISDKQIVYLNAKRFYKINSNRDSILTSDKKYDSNDELSVSDYDETHVVDITDCEELSIFIESNSYVKGLLSKLRVLIYEVTKVPCDWHFDTLKSIRNELIARCNCKNVKCNAKLTLTTEDNHKKMRISVKSYDSQIVHNSKSYTTGSHKQKVVSLLRQNTPYVTRALLAQEMVDEGDVEPSMLPKQMTLRKQKQRLNKLGSDNLDFDPIIAITKMKSNANFANSIYNIGINPFFVLYTTPTQKVLMQHENRKNKCILSVDATGISVLLSDCTSIS